jgi:hypothetical protein
MTHIILTAGTVNSVSLSLEIDTAIKVTHTCTQNSAGGLHCPHSALGSIALNQAAHVLYVTEGKYIRAKRP